MRINEDNVDEVFSLMHVEMVALIIIILNLHGYALSEQSLV